MVNSQISIWKCGFCESYQDVPVDVDSVSQSGDEESEVDRGQEEGGDGDKHDPALQQRYWHIGGSHQDRSTWVTKFVMNATQILSTSQCGVCAIIPFMHNHQLLEFKWHGGSGTVVNSIAVSWVCYFGAMSNTITRHSSRLWC